MAIEVASNYKRLFIHSQSLVVETSVVSRTTAATARHAQENHDQHQQESESNEAESSDRDMSVLVGVPASLLGVRDRRTLPEFDVNVVIIFVSQVVGLYVDRGKVGSAHSNKIEARELEGSDARYLLFLVLRVSKDLVKPGPLSREFDGKIPCITGLVPAVDGSVIVVDSLRGDVTEARVSGGSNNEAFTAFRFEKGDVIRSSLGDWDGGQLLNKVSVPVEAVGADRVKSLGSDHIIGAQVRLVNPVVEGISIRDSEAIFRA